jgi:transketolase
MQTFDKPLSRNDIATIRRRLLQMHFESGVGHIGGNLSALDAMLIVFHEYLAADDTFILSKGHSAGALYSTLWSIGRLTDEDLTRFHKDDTLLAGHPPSAGIPEIPFATGSLGHGLSLAAGTALGLRLRGSASRVFCLMSDGEWQEGSTWEALIFATHHGLANLTILIDHNNLQGFGTTESVASMAPLAKKLSGFDAEITVIDGHDVARIRAALNQQIPRLHVIVLETKKGSGVSFMENRMEWHYLPLNAEQYGIAIEELKNT